MYQPGSPETIVKTQETLHKLQRSPGGWQLANSLSNHENQQVRFFAALTFIVKLNTDAYVFRICLRKFIYLVSRKSLSEEDSQTLLATLINWLIRCLETSEGPLVLRKLCSTLVVFFFQFSSSWQNCVKHLIYCVYMRSAVPYESSQDAPDMHSMIRELPDTKAVVIFWFASTLVEEVGKTDSNSIKQ